MADQNHPSFVADAAGSAGVSTKPASGGAPPKDLFPNRNASPAPASPAGTLPAELFPMRRQEARTSNPHASPDPASVVPGTFPHQDTPAPGMPHARTLSMPKPFKLHG